jgi:hypothetical protein
LTSMYKRSTLWLAIIPTTLLIYSLLMLPSVSPAGTAAAQGGSAPSVLSLPYRVIDAEYSSTLDRIVMVSESPNRLSIYNPATNTSVGVDLPRPPLNVSVGPDGLFAAVGHDALISYVDLQQATLVKTLDVATTPIDVVLAGNGKVYISPASSQWVRLIAIDIATNIAASHTGNSTYAGTRYKLHPSGTSLYSAMVNLSPTDIEKMNISVHPPAYLYNSPYHGDYDMGGDLWMAEDGQRIFTACGNVFRASSVPSQDMTYNGSLRGIGLGSIGHLTHSAVAGKVLVVPQRRDYFSGCYGSTTLASTQVVIVNYEHLTLDRSVELPKFSVGASSYPANGRFVFANAAGSEFYTIVQAASNSGLLNDYGVVINPMSAPSPTPTASSTPTRTLTSSPTSPATATPTSQLTSTPIITPDTEGKAVLQLPYRVIDAEYSDTLDRIVMVSESPNRLYVYDPTTHSSIGVDLPRTPLNISVGPDGLFAAVGHDALVSYVNLQQATLVKTLDVTAISADIVLAGNGKVYVSPVRDQWTALRTIDIATNTEVLGSGTIRAGTRYKLHASGDYLYGADIGLSPSDIEKIDIRGNPPTLLYDSPYHGDYAMCGDIWMSADGLRVFTACANVFRTSTNRAQDMTYNGSLSGAGVSSIRHLTHSAAADRVLVIENEASIYAPPIPRRVTLVGYQHLTLDRHVALPSFTVGSSNYPAHGRFVFANMTGTKFYTIVQAASSSGLLNDYGVVINPMTLPTPTPTSSPTATATSLPETPTSTPTSSPTATATSLPETPTSTPEIPTSSPTATATSPTSTAVPDDELFFESNFASGAPGSVFIFSAGGFSSDMQATIALRRPGESNYQDIVTMPINAAGQLVFVLMTTPSDQPGLYAVRITVRRFGATNLAGSLSLVLEEEIQLSANEVRRTELPVESAPAIDLTTTYRVDLPLIMR